ncbi:MAG: GNAT family N-acetyltransferase [Bryobacteraceae bacterium]
MSKIRHLRQPDVPALIELSRQAGWNQTAADWERTLALAPEGAFGIESNGQIVSSTTVTCYADDLAWIGMVLTEKSHRGKGNAKALMEHALKYCKQRGVSWAKLDATELGRPIYAKLGFRDECPVERWKRAAGASPKASASHLIRPYIVDPSFDRAYFGAYRVPLLNALLRSGDSYYRTGFGYAMSRPGDLATYFGPCVVRTRDAARLLIECFLEKHGGEDVFWDLFPDNSDAVQLAIDFGFQPVRQLTRMVAAVTPERTPLLRHNASVFAIAGFEYG